MSKIVLEDFNEGNGYYKINLAYLSKEQVEEIEALVSKWKPTDEDIKNCIVMCLTDANEQRFNDYGTNLIDCLAWIEKQGKKPKKVSIWKHWKDGIAGGSECEQIFLTKIGSIYSISSCLGCECDYIELSELDKLLREEKQGKSKWTGEDDYNVQCCIAKAEKDITNGCQGRNKELIEWLKSLKQRMDEQQ